MTRIGKWQEHITELDERDVVDYLLHHPDFFIRNAAVVEQMRVPHPVRGSVSLIEWHVAHARKHIDRLQEDTSLLVARAPPKRFSAVCWIYRGGLWLPQA